MSSDYPYPIVTVSTSSASDMYIEVGETTLWITNDTDMQHIEKLTVAKEDVIFLVAAFVQALFLDTFTQMKSLAEDIAAYIEPEEDDDK